MSLNQNEMFLQTILFIQKLLISSNEDSILEAETKIEAFRIFLRIRYAIQSQTALDIGKQRQTALDSVRLIQTALDSVRWHQTALDSVRQRQTALDSVRQRQTALDSARQRQKALMEQKIYEVQIRLVLLTNSKEGKHFCLPKNT